MCTSLVLVEECPERLQSGQFSPTKFDETRFPQCLEGEEEEEEEGEKWAGAPASGALAPPETSWPVSLIVVGAKVLLSGDQLRILRLHRRRGRRLTPALHGEINLMLSACKNH